MALISDTHQFIFVHVWKTGGNSIREFLSPYSRNYYFPKRRGLFPGIGFRRCSRLPLNQHITFQELKAYVRPEEFNLYFKFAFVRNPLDLLVSYYHFITQHSNNHPKKDTIRKLGNFGNYIKWAAEHELHHLSQSKFVLSQEGLLLPDYLGRFEAFQQSFDEILNRLNLRKVKLKHLNASVHNHFMKYYNSSTEEMVRTVLAKDFKVFKY